MDYGGVHTAAVCYAENPDSGTLYLIKEYVAGDKTSEEHATDLRKWGASLWIGGSSSEEQWRREFRKEGLPVNGPRITEVEIGINRVFACHKENTLYVFDTCTKYLDEKMRYSRKLDASGQPTEAIKDKNDYHLMDAERYIVGFIRGGEGWLIA
jgi:hypothetical protein